MPDARLGRSTAIAVVAALALLGVVGLQLNRGLVALEDAGNDAVTLARFSARIHHLDEVLTMSTRMAAATGDPRWEKRYREHEPELAALITEVRTRPATSHGFRMVDEANALLVEIEERCMAEVRAGNLAAADTLLEGEDYRREKARYAHGLALAGSALEESAARSLAEARVGLMAEASLSALVVTLLMLTWFGCTRVWRRIARREADAREESRAIEQAKDEMISNVSHEMRTPLNGILGAADLMLSTQLSDEQRDLADTLRDSGMTLLDTVDDLLDFARVECDEIELIESDVDLRRVVNAVQDQYARRARAKGIDLTVGLDPRLPRNLRGDHLRYRQVLVQLVSNAVKFTQRGEIAVRVELDTHARDQVLVRTHVRDTGVGIDPAAQPGLLAVCDRTQLPAARRGAGTGLGLVLAQRLARLLGGDLQVRSAPGEGSTFTFSCTFRAGARSVVEAPHLGDVRALVVGDGSPNLRSAWELMLSWGASTERVEAWSEVEGALGGGDPFQFVLCDLNDSSAEISALLEANESLHVLSFLEAGATVPIHHERLEVLGRPVQESELHDRIRGVLDGTGTRCLCRRAGPATGPRVLLVEDNPVNRKIARQFLTGLGCRVEVAGHGGVALRRLEQERFDLVFMDCQMPEVDGYEATRTLRQLEADGRHTPVVALTANAMIGDREKCLAAGMDDFLTKPANRAVLAEAIERWAGTPRE